MVDLSGPLGMCVKAGACSFGFENTLKMLKKRKSFLVLVSDEASENSKKRIYDKCKFYNTEIKVVDITQAIMKLKLNYNIKIISVNDINFKKLIDKRLKGDT